MKKTTLLLIPLFCLLLLGAGCAEEQDFDKNTTPPTIDNAIPYYEINLDSGQIEDASGEIVTDDAVEIEYGTAE